MSRDQIDQGDHDRTRQRAIRKVKGKPFRERERNLHSRVRVGQAGRPLPPKALSILEGLTLKLLSLYDHN